MKNIKMYVFDDAYARKVEFLKGCRDRISNYMVNDWPYNSCNDASVAEYTGILLYSCKINCERALPLSLLCTREHEGPEGGRPSIAPSLSWLLSPLPAAKPT